MRASVQIFYEMPLATRCTKLNGVHKVRARRLFSDTSIANRDRLMQREVNQAKISNFAFSFNFITSAGIFCILLEAPVLHDFLQDAFLVKVSSRFGHTFLQLHQLILGGCSPLTGLGKVF